jgi:hypothetical protein
MNEEKRSGSLAGLRSTALLAIVVGATASIGLLRHAPQHPPRLLAILFVIWVGAPFALLAIANFFSPRWPAPVRQTLYLATLVISVASVAVYIDNSVAHRTTHPGAIWVAVPPASIIVSAIAIGLAALRTRAREKSL